MQGKSQVVFMAKVLVPLCLLMSQTVQLTRAQRPSFAGSRPAGGLNQKDKYNQPALAAGLAPTQQTPLFVNRFGAANNNNDNDDNNEDKKNNSNSGSNISEVQVQQRPPALGGLPIVYPESKYEPIRTPSPLEGGIQNRFGGAGDTNDIGNSVSTRPNTLPLDAFGDRDLVNQLNRLPVDKQPFWFVNYKAIEAQRNRSVTNSGLTTVARSFFAG